MKYRKISYTSFLMKKILSKNKRAFFDYEILDTLVAGLVLRGYEVKSLREGRVSLGEAHARIINNEAWLINCNIPKYKQYTGTDYDPVRTRKLLLNKKEISRLIGKTKEKGLALMPLNIFLRNNKLVKVELGLGKGKKMYDKRESIKKREVERSLKRKFGRI